MHLFVCLLLFFVFVVGLFVVPLFVCLFVLVNVFVCLLTVPLFVCLCFSTEVSCIYR